VGHKEKKIAIVDYQMGNLRSVLNAFRFLGENAYIAETAEKIKDADAIVIPGVGAFGQAMKNLTGMGIVDILNHKVLVEKKPLLGICLGMQLIAEYSEEGGRHKGLGWIPGCVELIPVKKGTRLPHIGWNELQVKLNAPLLQELKNDLNFYFVHSYFFNCMPEHISSTVVYDVEITASIQKENIFGVQFHPEKSQENGLRLLRQFINVIPGSQGSKGC
jgi:glutamine amidotransferase